MGVLTSFLAQESVLKGKPNSIITGTVSNDGKMKLLSRKKRKREGGGGGGEKAHTKLFIDFSSRLLKFVSR